MYAAGADTTSAAIMTFFLAMLLHPAAQLKAQAEIDTIVGRGQLPSFANRDELPYVDALVKEVLRWFPVSPIGTWCYI